MTKFSLTVKTDDVTSGRRGVDPHGQFSGEWINGSFVFFLFFFFVVFGLGDKASAILSKRYYYLLSKAQNIVT